MDITIVSTAHTSEESGDVVSETIRSVDPDVVALELDDRRYSNLVNENDNSENPPLNVSLKARIIAGAFSKIQSKVGSELGGIVGIDMESGVNTAKEMNKEMALIDRDLGETLDSLSDQISNLGLISLLVKLAVSYSYISIRGIDKSDQEDLMSQDAERIVQIMEDQTPMIKKVLLDERNEIMAKKLQVLSDRYDTAVVVIGYAHKPGLIDSLNEMEEINVIETRK